MDGQAVDLSVVGCCSGREGTSSSALIYFDAATYRKIDGRTIEQHGKRKGKEAGTTIWAVSPDGKEMHQTSEGVLPNGQSYRNETWARRVSGGSGDDPFSGKWETDLSRSRLSTPMIYTISDVDNGIAFRSSSGLSYTAKFDGKPYPANAAEVSLTRAGDRSIHVVMKRKDGTVLRTSTMTVSGDELTETTEVRPAGGATFKTVNVFRRQ